MRRPLLARVLVALIAAFPLGAVAARASHGITLPLAVTGAAVTRFAATFESNIEGEESRVTGRVLHAGTGAPLPGARVRESGPRGASVLAGEDGAFVLPVSPGTRQVRVTADGFRPETASIRVAAGQAAVLEVRLQPVVLSYEEELMVTVTRQERSAAAIPLALSVVDRSAIESRAPQSAPDAIADTPGVLLQKTNRGAGSPYLRGLVGNQVLVLVDGVRLNNATFRYGPNQYLATIDPASVERIEVLRGSGSVLHGSDAIGGVINVVTRRAQLSDGPTRVSGAVSGKVMTGGMERSGRFEAEVSSPRAAVRGGLSLRAFGDLIAGGSLGKESPSGYDEGAGDLSAVLRAGRTSLFQLSFQHLGQSDVPRYDQVAQRGYAYYAFDPQVRQLVTAGWQLFPTAGPLARLDAVVSSHRTRERRKRQAVGSNLRIVEQDRVNTWGVTIDAEMRRLADWTLAAGLDAYHDRIGSWRRDEDQATGAVTARRGLYPDGASALAVAGFLTGSWSHGPMHVDLGGRWSGSRIRARDASFGVIAVSPAALVGSIAARYEVSPGLELVGSVAQAFRAPNLDDMSTLGAFDYGIEVPSPDLSPERAVAVEGGFRAKVGRTGVSASVYRTSLRDLIDRVRSSYLGDSMLEGQAVYRRANVARAFVRGAEVEAEARLSPSLRASVNLTYTYGQQSSLDQPMRRIPPLNGGISLRWEPSDRGSVEGRLRMAGAQRRLAPGDLADHRIAKGGTDGWTVFDVEAGYRLGPRVRLAAGLSNLFDEAYRVHGSGIDGVGRSAWLATRVGF